MKNSVGLLVFLCLLVSPVAAKDGVVTPPFNNAAVSALPNVIISPGSASAQFEEYRHNGRLYMVKVTPRKGYAYYLIDSSGDGLFDVRHANLRSQLTVPQWVLKRW